MITYVDTSTLLKLLIEEEGSERAELIWDGADVLASAAIVLVEARAALASAERGRRLSSRQHQAAKAELADVVGSLTVVDISDHLLTEAADLAEHEALRGFDAVHLAAALLVEARVLASADRALCEAAGRRGLHVANPLDE